MAASRIAQRTPVQAKVEPEHLASKGRGVPRSPPVAGPAGLDSFARPDACPVAGVRGDAPSSGRGASTPSPPATHRARASDRGPPPRCSTRAPPARSPVPWTLPRACRCREGCSARFGAPMTTNTSGADHRSRVALLVVEEHVPAHVHVLPPPEVRPEHGQRIEHRHELELGLRHRLVIRAGVVHPRRRAVRFRLIGRPL